MKKLLGIVLSATMLLTACTSKADDLKLKETSFTYELGSEISFNAKDYLQETSEEILNKTTLEVFSVEEGKVSESPLEVTESLEMGEYVFKISHNEEVEEVKVLVEDTTAPAFVDFVDEVTFTLGEETDLTQLFKTEDLSQVEVTVEGDVDFASAGEYQVKLVATDEAENKTEKECTIIVKEKEVASNTTTNKPSSTSQNTTTSSSSESSNTGTTTPSQPEQTPSKPEEKPSQSNSGKPSPENCNHKFIDSTGKVHYPNDGLTFREFKDALAKGDEIQQYDFTHSVEESMEKWGDWKSISVIGYHCENCDRGDGLGELWSCIVLEY